MKNKFILAFLLIPVVISCQNTVNVSSSSSPQPSKSSVNTNTISFSPINSIIVSASPSVSIIPSITPQPTLSDIQESKTPIIESNMFDYIPEITRPTYPPEKINEWVSNELRGVESPFIESLGYLSGRVLDSNNNPIHDAKITLRNLQYKFSLLHGYDYIVNTTTDLNGVYEIKIPILTPVTIIVTKENYTQRYLETKPNNLAIGGVYTGRNDFILNKSPEINSIKINNNIITPYRSDLAYDKLQNIYTNFKISVNTIIPRLKLKKTNYLEIYLSFNNSIQTESIEKNFYMESIDKSIYYDSSNCNFFWSENNKRLFLKLYIKENESNIIYRFGFKDKFIDTNNNLALEKEYISLSNPYFVGKNELSENIVFEIIGSK